jgi:hypothetical protein
MIDEFKEANPSAVVPSSLHSCLQWDNFIHAVTHNDIGLLELKRHRDPTRTAKTMHDTLSLSPDLAPVGGLVHGVDTGSTRKACDSHFVGHAGSLGKREGQ